MSSSFRLEFLCLFLAAGVAAADEAVPPAVEITEVTVDPPEVRLSGPQSRYSLLVHGRTAAGRMVDLTAAARFRSRIPGIAEVSTAGVIRGVSDGAATIEVEAAGATLAVPVVISESSSPRTFNFENDIIPLLSRFGCNTSGCHGKAEGQNGFKLSVFGFDPRADYVALTQEARGRRVFPVAPDRSLLLTKASGGAPHGGGIRIRKGSSELKTLRDWIAAGMPFGDAADPKVVSIRVTPHERQMALRGRQQLRVVAVYSDGHEADVTTHARYQSNNEGLGTIDESGLMTAGEAPGEVAIMASYLGAVDIFLALVPRAEEIPDYPAFPERNFIDALVSGKLRKLNLLPSDLCDDADYLRRVYLDVIGTLPTADEARQFLADTRPDRRALLVNELLRRPEYADYWALKWADLLRVDRQALGHKGAYSYYRWIRDRLAANQPYDQFVRDVVAAEGPLVEAPAGHFFKAVTKPGEMAGTVSQVFLGMRIECAQCHHHPFDRWSQDDYFGMQAFFTQVGFKRTARGEALVAGPGSETRHPRTNAVVFAHPLGTVSPEAEPAGDRRKLLADWMTAPDNPWLARNLVNRVWAHFLGRGLVEPVDDVRLTNPPTNPELLEALATHFVESRYDQQTLIRTITSSHVYQLSSRPNATNERDSQNYSRAWFKRLDAEVLFDALCQTTGVDEKFDGLPAGYRAIQLWDSKVPHYFLKLFGRPTRVTACECERSVEPSVAQVLHVLNSTEIQEKLTHAGGRVAKLARLQTDDGQLVEELYLTFYSRFPTPSERQVAVEYLAAHADNRRQAAEDLSWTMLNSLEFLFNH
jgi:hypothetical protein